jgi:hypothetical protein
MKLDIMYIIAEREKREREKRERDEGRQLPLYIDDRLPVEKPEAAEDHWRT